MEEEIPGITGVEADRLQTSNSYVGEDEDGNTCIVVRSMDVHISSVNDWTIICLR